MLALTRHLQFRPHGDKLLTSSATFWLFSARVLVFAMAISEAIGWSYLGYLFGEGAGRWASAAFVGVAIFLVVWMIDVSLITLDRAWDEHARLVLGLPDTSPRGRKLRDASTFVIRIALLLASLTITAPYLAQVVFHKDIDRYINAEATAAVDSARKQLDAQSELTIRSKQNEINERRLQYEREVAGKGASGRYGDGPAARAILDDVVRAERERDRLVRVREEAVAKFDSVARNWRDNRDQISAQYGIALPQPSILENRKALDALRNRPENRSTELAIKAFLAIIFGGLLLLKLFEPSSVRLYLSEVLQQEYGRYLAGSFDDLLPTVERSTAVGYVISPQRLYEFLIRVWAPIRRLEEQQAEASARYAAAAQTMDLLQRVQAQLDAELKQVDVDVQRLRALTDEADESVTQLHSAIDTVAADVEAFRTELEQLSSNNSSLDDKSRLEYRSILSAKLSEADRALHELREAVPTEAERQRRTHCALKDAESMFEGKRTELVEAGRKIRSIREMLTEAAGARARVLLHDLCARGA